ncbi:hypothetical protein [Streptosporangium roseum]|uniref:hypothetical protein n=1 Tax=Streptosporangium roseum TaxID=2001 RepID=UPI003319FECF
MLEIQIQIDRFQLAEDLHVAIATGEYDAEGAQAFIAYLLPEVDPRQVRRIFRNGDPQGQANSWRYVPETGAMIPSWGVARRIWDRKQEGTPMLPELIATYGPEAIAFAAPAK